MTHQPPEHRRLMAADLLRMDDATFAEFIRSQHLRTISDVRARTQDHTDTAITCGIIAAFVVLTLLGVLIAWVGLG